MKKLDIVKALLADEETTVESIKEGVKIAILQRGWVFVGEFSKSGSYCKITNAYNIRTWGTTKGLGELASDGPTPNTKLDKINDVTFHELTAVALIDCDKTSWKKQF